MLVQTHFAVTIQPAQNNHLLLDRTNIKQIIGERDTMTTPNTMMLQDRFGHFYNLHPDPNNAYARISNGQSYETIQHKFTDKSFETSLFLVRLFGGCPGTGNLFYRLRTRGENKIAELKGYIHALLSQQLDLRIEIVESSVNIEEISSFLFNLNVNFQQ